jgi:hypothetical protein
MRTERSSPRSGGTYAAAPQAGGTATRGPAAATRRALGESLVAVLHLIDEHYGRTSLADRGGHGPTAVDLSDDPAARGAPKASRTVSITNELSAMITMLFTAVGFLVRESGRRHRPDAPDQRLVGLVTCSPFGQVAVSIVRPSRSQMVGRRSRSRAALLVFVWSYRRSRGAPVSSHTLPERVTFGLLHDVEWL